MNKLNTVLILFFIISSVYTLAQNSISVSSTQPIFVEINPSFQAGSVNNKVIIDDSQWLNYTTEVHETEPTASITASIVSGSIPGLEIQIEASEYQGVSRSKMGAPAGKISLSHKPQVIIYDINTCYTGAKKNEGHRLKYIFRVTDYAKLETGLSSIYIQYTISQ